MQTIWSRIAQTGISCHCPSCVSAGASGVARRTTTAAGKRPVRWALSSTFVYSGIFAAAATTDAGIKQRRRDQWDRAIADIKHDLDQPVPEHAATEQHKEPDEETVRFRPISDEPLEALLKAASTPDNSVPIWPTNTGMPLKRTFVAPQSIYATHVARRRAASNRWTPKKLRLTELSVDQLIARLLLHLDLVGIRPLLTDLVPEPCHSFFFAPTTQLEDLWAYSTKQYLAARSHTDPYADLDQFPRQHEHGVTYSEDALGEYQQTAAQLNRALAMLFQRRRDGELTHAELVTKICYNLYISPAAPNVHCWNTLLTGLLENDEDTPLINPVIRAIRNANVRMNETTMKTVLKYHIITDNRKAFGAFVDKMRGLDGGLSLTTKDIKVTDSGRSRLIQDNASGKVVQLPYPTPGVFETLIEGVLHFVGFEAALRICKDMGQQGWGLSIRGLTPLLDDRAIHADWESGCQVWNLIKELQQDSVAKGQAETLFAQTYTAMLRLCSVCKETRRFDDIMQEALDASYSSHRLLSLFKQEMQPRPRRALPYVVRWEYLNGCHEREYERLNPKAGRAAMNSAEAPGPSSDNTSESQPMAELAVDAEDGWLDEPSAV